MAELTICLAQVIGDSEPETNIATARRYTRQAARTGADLLLLPEMFMALPGAQTTPGKVAEPLDGNFGKTLAAIAREEKIAICAGVWESSGDGQPPYNTAVVWNAAGERLAAYRKLHLFDALAVKESDLMVAGDTPPPVFSLKGMRVGLAICYDLRFPEHFRYLSDQGADVMLVPAAWYAGPMKEEMWLCLLRARAMENVCYAAGAVLAGGSFAARSCAFDPFGVPLADAGEAEGLVTFTARSSRIEAVRAKLPAIDHRRMHIFS